MPASTGTRNHAASRSAYFAPATDYGSLIAGWARGGAAADTRQFAYTQLVTESQFTPGGVGPQPTYSPGAEGVIQLGFLPHQFFRATHWIMGPVHELEIDRNFRLGGVGNFVVTEPTTDLDDRVGIGDVVGGVPFLSTYEKLLQLFQTQPTDPHARPTAQPLCPPTRARER